MSRIPCQTSERKRRGPFLNGVHSQTLATCDHRADGRARPGAGAKPGTRPLPAYLAWEMGFIITGGTRAAALTCAHPGRRP
jgi:hypothetical protein